MANLDLKNVRFNIVRHVGERNKAILPDGTVIERQEKVFIKEEGGFVPIAPETDHFCFLFPQTKEWEGKWFSSCSCGSPAILVGSNVYAHLGSPSGKMLICFNFLTFGKHLDLGK